MDTPEWVRSLPVGNLLGEGVLWHPDPGAAWWTDIHGCRLYRYTLATDELEYWDTPERLASFGFIKGSERLIAAFESGFAFYNPFNGERHWLAQPEVDLPGNRFNDGKVDRQGRFWAGTMVEQGNPQEADPAGALYCWSRGQQAVPHLRGIGISNGLCWSPDGCTAYLSDSARSVYYAYDFEPHSASFSNRRIFARTPEGVGPDGSCVDGAGNIWNAQYGGGQVVCYSPKGECLLELSVPVSQPTCVAFGGPDYSWLFVTTARENLSEAELTRQPEAGNLLIYRTDHQGLPTSFFVDQV